MKSSSLLIKGVSVLVFNSVVKRSAVFFNEVVSSPFFVLG